MTGVQAMALGWNHTCVLTTSGGVRCWGDNSYGQLGNPNQLLTHTPPTADVLTGVAAVSTGDNHTCALLTTGGMRCWGDNQYGQLGRGTGSITQATPPTSDVLQDVQAMAAGGGHTCALTKSGGVRCWGSNEYGQLGDGTLTNRLVPSNNDILTGVKAIATGEHHTCALMMTNSVRCWGRNFFGPLSGSPAESFRPNPTPVISCQ